MRHYTFDRLGVYTGFVDIEDVYAPIPASSTMIEPPEVAEGKVAIFTGNGWVESDLPQYGKTTAEMLAEELAALASVYEEDTLGFQRRMATITLADGPTEAAKIATIRAQWQTRKTQYITDSAAVRAKYTVGV